MITTIILTVLLGLALMAAFMFIARIPQFGDPHHRHGFAKRDESFAFLGRAFRFLLGRPHSYGLANIAEGATPKGRISRFPDVQIPCGTHGLKLYLLAKRSTSGHATLCAKGDIPIGVFHDSTDRGSFGGSTVTDKSLPLMVQLFGANVETELVSINSTVAEGDLLVTDDNGYAMTLPAATAGAFYVFGRALQGGVAGDSIEFDPVLPLAGSGFVPIFAAVMPSTTASTADHVLVTGLLTTDIPMVTLNTIAASETIVKTAKAAAGQINIVLDAAATVGTTKYNVVVYRAINS